MKTFKPYKRYYELPIKSLLDGFFKQLKKQKEADPTRRGLFLMVTPAGGSPSITPGYYEDAGAAVRRQAAVQAGLPEGWTVTPLGGAG